MKPFAPSFVDWPLHDAVLSSIVLDWHSSSCAINLRAQAQPDQKARSCTIIFQGVRHLAVPHHSPWGPSACINHLRLDGDNYVIEVQSGDVIVVEADTVRFEFIEEDGA